MKTITLGLVLLGMILGAGAAPTTELERLFQNPPDESRPLTWWHWINGNVTKDGITKDLEAMKRQGLAGCYLFDIAGGFPEGPARFMQPGWLALMDHTVSEARRLGLTFGIHNCDGWEASGGPWITPEKSMKELTWSVTEIQGPGRVKAALMQPHAKLDYYRDIAVVAYPAPAGGPLRFRVCGELNETEAAKLMDGDPATVISFEAGTTHTIELALEERQTARSLVFSGFGPFTSERDFPIRLEAAENGRDFRSISNFTLNWDGRDEKPITVSFNDTRAQKFRLVFNNPWAFTLGGIELSNAARSQFREAKAGFVRQRGHGGETQAFDNYPGPDRGLALPPQFVLRRGDVKIITGKMAADGKLDWDAPAGRWHVLRVGYTSTARQNAPANVEGRGLECDKFDPAAVRFHLEQYVGKLRERYGVAAGKAFSVFETDSWECGIQNWTAGLEGRFKQEFGYDLEMYLPLICEGCLIEGYDASERMLWDWRRCLADQIAAYYGEVARFARERGLTYVAEGSGRQQYLYDPLVYQRAGDIPMGEFWAGGDPGSGVRVDNKVAASMAHLTGRRLVASESYTSPLTWDHHPFSLKALGDRAFCAGVNRYVFHTFAHQPYTIVGPGYTMGKWGLSFNRANTWWEPARAWVEYLARCNALLQEGQFQADVLAFIGEDTPNYVGWRESLTPPLPAGYDFDACDGQAIMDASVRDGRIVMPSGMSYRILLLPARRAMRPAMLEKIASLAREGATVVGGRVTQSPSLSRADEGDAQVQRLAEDLWGGGAEIAGERRVGRGLIFSGMSFEQIFNRLGMAPDFSVKTEDPGAEVIYIHRRIGEADVYFLSNQEEEPVDFTAGFRVGNCAPELWDPATGTTMRSGVYQTDQDSTRVPLRLDPYGSIFVVLRPRTAGVHVVEIRREKPASVRATPAPTPAGSLKANAEITDNFTMAAWIKPAGSIPLPEERKVDIAFRNQNWVIPAVPGHQVYGEGHAGCGLAAGENGVAVFEHSARYAPSVAVWAGALRDWTHVAVVYRAGIPSIYINGKPARTGKRGQFAVHPSAGPAPRVSTRFKGQARDVMQFDRALDAGELKALAQGSRPPREATARPIEVTTDEKGGMIARVMESGAATVRLSDGSETRLEAELPAARELCGPWRVEFPPHLGAPPAAEFKELGSWSENAEKGIRYFSGTATYRKEFEIPAELIKPELGLELDLGRVAVIAQVKLNGHQLGILWKPPFRADVKGAARAGRNELEVQVTNLWTNRLIGDEQLPDDIKWNRRDFIAGKWPEWLGKAERRPGPRVAFATKKVYTRASPLAESGLIGPVRLVPVQVIRIGQEGANLKVPSSPSS